MMFGVMTQVVSILLNFITRTIFIRCLSTEYLGIEGLFSNVLTMLSLAELGIGSSIIYAMYKPAAEGDNEKLGKLLYFYRKAYHYVALCVLVMGIVLSFFLDKLIKEVPDIPEHIQVIFWMFLINSAASYLLAYKQAIIVVNQDKYIDSIVKQICKVLQLIAQSVFLWLTHAYYVYLIIQIATTVINNLILSGYVDRKYPWIKGKKYHVPLPDSERKELFVNVKALSMSRIAGVVSYGADNVIIAKILGLVSVGIVSNYNLVISALNSVIWNGLDNMVGNIGNFNAGASLEQRRKLFDEIYFLTFWLYTFLSVSLLVLINPFMSIWIGEEFTVGSIVLYALIFNMYVNGMNYPLYSFRSTMGYFDQVKFYFVVSAILNIVASVFLGLKFGIFGVYIASPLSRLVTSELAEMRVVTTKILEKNTTWYLLRYLVSTVFVVALYFLLYNIVGIIPMTGVWTFIARCVVCVILLNAVIIAVFWSSPVFQGVKIRVENQLKGKL